MSLLVIATAQLMFVLDDTIANIALPSIQRDLGVSAAILPWIVSAYVLAFGGLLPYLGRTLNLVPSAALRDPDADPLALAEPDAGGAQQVVALQLDGAAPQAAAVVAAVWKAWACDASACQRVTASRKYPPLAPILNAAGWYQPAPGNPQTLSQPGDWARWTNTTGQVAGVTLYGDELQLLYSQTEIVASTLRERLQWVWNGTDFAAP